MDRRNKTKKLMACGLALVMTLAAAQAGTQYDVKLERAVMDLIARRIGPLRPGLAYDAGIAHLVAPPREPATERAPLASARRANTFWLPKGKEKAKVSRRKTTGSFQTIGEPADKSAGQPHATRKGAIPKVLKF